jgi:hypothetical protein
MGFNQVLGTCCFRTRSQPGLVVSGVSYAATITPDNGRFICPAQSHSRYHRACRHVGPSSKPVSPQITLMYSLNTIIIQVRLVLHRLAELHPAAKSNNANSGSCQVRGSIEASRYGAEESYCSTVEDTDRPGMLLLANF